MMVYHAGNGLSLPVSLMHGLDSTKACALEKRSRVPGPLVMEIRL
jgi:hypothetical protein